MVEEYKEMASVQGSVSKPKTCLYSYLRKAGSPYELARGIVVCES